MRARLIPLAAAVLVLATAGCNKNNPPRASLELTDALGRTVGVDVPVQRIVTMAPNLTEITFAAGAGDNSDTVMENRAAVT